MKKKSKKAYFWIIGIVLVGALFGIYYLATSQTAIYLNSGGMICTYTNNGYTCMPGGTSSFVGSQTLNSGTNTFGVKLVSSSDQQNYYSGLWKYILSSNSTVNNAVNGLTFNGCGNTFFGGGCYYSLSSNQASPIPSLIQTRSRATETGANPCSYNAGASNPCQVTNYYYFIPYGNLNAYFKGKQVLASMQGVIYDSTGQSQNFTTFGYYDLSKHSVTIKEPKLSTQYRNQFTKNWNVQIYLDKPYTDNSCYPNNQESCIGTISYVCSNYQLTERGVINGKCGVSINESIPATPSQNQTTIPSQPQKASFPVYIPIGIILLIIFFLFLKKKKRVGKR